ncbi:MAG: cysteine desulfurase [Ruminococcaceae bacterium]|nr:cysteine desulfurase [Oscillospiraceae bacterium]
MKEKKREIYADYAATSPVLSEVKKAMEPYLTDCFGNPSSLHSQGQAARCAVEKGRQQAASLVGAEAEEIFFTSCGTESSNWAIKGTAFAELARGGSRRRILVSAIEHPSVLAACDSLIDFGFSVERIPVGGNGVISLESLSQMIGDDCVLAAVMHANNETGVIQPVEECARIAHESGALFLTDAVQTVGHIPVDVKEIGCDFLSFSGHKFGAPKGIGGLYVRKECTLPPLIHGGGQEKGSRSGTENVPYIVGLGEACRLAEERLESDAIMKTESVRDWLEAHLVSSPGGKVIGRDAPRLSGITNISFEGIFGENLMLMCDLYGLRISTGSACSMGKGDDISHVLRAMKLSESAAAGSVRISLGTDTTMSDAEQIYLIIEDCVRKIRGASAAK